MFSKVFCWIERLKLRQKRSKIKAENRAKEKAEKIKSEPPGISAEIQETTENISENIRQAIEDLKELSPENSVEYQENHLTEAEVKCRIKKKKREYGRFLKTSNFCIVCHKSLERAPGQIQFYCSKKCRKIARGGKNE